VSGLQGADTVRGVHPDIAWELQLEHGEKVGLGQREDVLVNRDPARE
jgi:uncharacterized Fe-S center protein